jgi:glutamate dehydrogenase/leucine dehydrogenase
MKELLKKYENKRPEIVFEWNDPYTEARGWIVINSLRGGAAGGGTRMRKGLDMREVESLAKTMEIKFTVSGPAIGGAKSGIDFDPADPRKKEVLTRWYKTVIPLLKTYYGTGGDLNVDEVHEVIPITEKFGLLHPQEGVVTGHFGDHSYLKSKLVNQLKTGVSKILESAEFSPEVAKKFLVADMITGYGVSESVRHYYELTGESYKDKKVIVQGWGNVGAAAAFYAAQSGAKVVGIIDRVGGLISKDGFTFDEIRTLFLNRKSNTLVSDSLIPFEEVNQKIWDVPCDIFLPCAASRILDKDQVERMVNAGLKVISSGANVPFKDPEIFYGTTMQWADNHVILIPDFIANCGMARVFAYCMTEDAKLTDEAIFEDTSLTIKTAIEKVLARQKKETFAATAFEIALAQLT